MRQNLVEQIDAILPQTQCTKCGFSGCLPYAQAISQNNAEINQCPPGGQKGIQALSKLLGLPSKPLNPKFGIEKPRTVAVIIEKDCIGCTKCLPPCPVDAIIGASKQMHTVISSVCTGCELCVVPCPVDCIIMQPIESGNNASVWNRVNADNAKRKYHNKSQRMERLKADKIKRQKKQKSALAKLKSAKQ